MRQLLRVSPWRKGEARCLRRAGDVEYSEGVTVAVSSWRERGGQKWVGLQVVGAILQDGTALPAIELYIPVEAFEGRTIEIPGPSVADVTK